MHIHHFLFANKTAWLFICSIPVDNTSVMALVFGIVSSMFWTVSEAILSITIDSYSVFTGLDAFLECFTWTLSPRWYALSDAGSFWIWLKASLFALVPRVISSQTITVLWLSISSAISLELPAWNVVDTVSPSITTFSIWVILANHTAFLIINFTIGTIDVGSPALVSILKSSVL